MSQRSQPRNQSDPFEDPFESDIESIQSSGEQHEIDDLELDPDAEAEGVDTTQDSEGHTTMADDTQSPVSSFESQGSLHLSDLQGGAGKKKKKTAKKKTAKKKTAKKKTATKKKTAKKKTATKKTEEKKKGILGLFMGGKNKKKPESKQYIAPMERLI